MNSSFGKCALGLTLMAVTGLTSVPAFGEKIIIPPLEREKIYCAPVKVEAKQCAPVCPPTTVQSSVTVERPVASLKSTETITETISEKSSAPKMVRKRSSFKRSSFKRKRVARKHTMRRHVARRPMTRIVTKAVTIERTKVIEKIVEKPVYIDRIVEKPVYIEKCIEKPVYIDRVIEKQVMIEQPVILKKKRSHLIRLGTPLLSVGVL